MSEPKQDAHLECDAQGVDRERLPAAREGACRCSSVQSCGASRPIVPHSCSRAAAARWGCWLTTLSDQDAHAMLPQQVCQHALCHSSCVCIRVVLTPIKSKMSPEMGLGET